MDQDIRFMPEQASSYAAEVDALYLLLWGITAFFTLLICVLVVYLGVRYRRGAKVNRVVRATHRQLLLVEIGWMVPPLVIVMAVFVLGAYQYYRVFSIPADGLDISVVGKQWMWSTQHPSGRRERNTLHVPTGTPVRLTMISEDVIHSFFIPVFRNKMDVLPGRYTRMWFTPTRPGEYHLFCAEYCGTSHSDMVGKVVVMEPEAYAEWAAAENSDAPSRTGERLFAQHRCTDCHEIGRRSLEDEGEDRPSRAPSLVGLFGRTERLADGRNVPVDDTYIRRSIRDPRHDVVAGYSPIMPVFTEKELDEHEIRYIIEYIQSLAQPAEGAQAPTEEGQGRRTQRNNQPPTDEQDGGGNDQ